MGAGEGVSQDLVFYDGSCGLCHGTVLFLLKRDGDGSRFLYAPLQGETFLQRVTEAQRQGLPDSVVVLQAGGGLLLKSDGVIHLLKRLGGVWPLVGKALALLPRGLRDWGYDRVASVRKRLFRKPEGACPLVPQAFRFRFLS
jgi:predicted DCC family thiol-disulfide oxidoreductase YuxK